MLIAEVYIFHAETTMEGGELMTFGGRFLSVTSVRNNLKEAVDAAYQAAGAVSFDKMHEPTDISVASLSSQARI